MCVVTEERKSVVRKEIENLGFTLLEDFKSSAEKLNLICPEGHYWEVLLGNFRKRICPKCNIKYYKKYDYAYVKQIIESEMYKLLSRKYIDVFSKLKTKCPNGHIYLVNFRAFTKGNRCPLCPRKNNTLKLNYQDVKDQIENEGYYLVSKSYSRAKVKLEIICNNGHFFEMTWDKFKTGHRCVQCHNQENRNENHWNWKGGNTSENSKIRSSEEYKIWREIVYERDYFICQCCLRVGGKLNAHHIENFSENPDLRLDPDNGITLCEDCHSQTKPNSFHARYTQFNNNRQQLEEYIEQRRKELNIN